MNQISKRHLDDLRAHVAMAPMSSPPTSQPAEDDTEILAPDGQEKAIGERLAQARTAAKLSKAAMAKVIGRRGAQVITDYETGTSKVRLSTVRQIAAATGADVTWLWLGREPQTASAIQAPAADDAALIALCHRLLANIDAVDADPNDIEEGDVRMDEQRRLEAEILTIAPTTFVGHHLRAQAYLRRNGGTFPDGSRVSDFDSEEIWPILRDLAAAMPLRDSLALGTAHFVPAVGPSAEITTAVAAVVSARALRDHVAATTPDDDAAYDASADVHGDALDACGSVRITTLADASAIAALALRNLAADDITGQADVVTRGLLESLAGITSVAPTPEPVLTLIAEANRLRAEAKAFPWDTSNDAEFNDLCSRTRAAIDAVAAAPTSSSAGLRAAAQFILDEQASSGTSGGFNHSDAESAALVLLKRLAGDPEAANPDTDIIARCEKVEAAWNEYDRVAAELDALPRAEHQAHELDVVNPAYNAAADLFDAIADGPIPQTSEGLRAAARAAIFQASDNRVEGPHSVEMCDKGSELAWRLIGHLAGLEVRSVQVKAA